MGRRHEGRFDRLGRRVLDGPGRLDRAVRRAAGRRALDDLPEAVRAYVAKVHDHAYKVTNDDVTGLLDAGYTEDEVFELTAAAAVGAGLSRLDAARRAMGSQA
jgi:hypothetical protein